MINTPRTESEYKKIAIVCEDEYCAAWAERDGESVYVVDIKFAIKLESDLEILRAAIRKASNDFNKLAWGSDGNLGADRIIASLDDLLPENQ